MKKLFALVLALALALSLVACGGSKTEAPAADTNEPADTSAEASAPVEETEGAESDLAYVQDKGTLIVGITDFEPMDYKDADGNWIGFDADLATLFADSLGVEVQFQEIDWDYKVQELDNLGIDCIWNGMTLVPEVTDVTCCANAYMRNAQVVILPADKAADYADVESMADLTFAVEKGSAGNIAVDALGYATNPVATQADALMEVSGGTSDAAVIDLLMAYAMTGEGTSYDNLTYTLSLEEEQYGVAFRQGSDLAEALNTFMAENMDAMNALADQYGLSGTVIEQ